MGEAKRRKLSRDATPEEIFPPEESHGPVQPEAYELMNRVIKALSDAFGDNYDITLFVAEKESSSGRKDPRFNYASTANRKDMVAVLEAFVKRNRAEWAKLETAENLQTPTSKSKQ